MLTNRLFMFNCFNFYLPAIWLMFFTTKTNFMDLFNLMLVQMGYKQISANIIEYLMPIILAKRKLDSHNKEYDDVLQLYDDSKIGENLKLKKAVTVA